MTPLRKAANEAAHSYMRSGGKTNRRKQRYLLFRFIDFCHENGTVTPDQVGQKTVIRYWKKHRTLSDRVLKNHFLAIATLWRFLNKPGEPPRPYLSQQSAPEGEKMLNFNQQKSTTITVRLSISEELNKRLEKVKTDAIEEGGVFDVEGGLSAYLEKQIRRAESELAKKKKMPAPDSPSTASGQGGFGSTEGQSFSS